MQTNENLLDEIKELRRELDLITANFITAHNVNIPPSQIKAEYAELVRKIFKLNEFKIGHDNSIEKMAKEYKAEQVETLRAQLKEAEEVIGFYSDAKSWFYPGKDFHNFQIAKEDVSKTKRITIKGNEENISCGGKKAREYMKKYGERT